MIDRWYEELRGYGLSLPEAVEEFPWGHSALKVRGKTFVFLSKEDGAASSPRDGPMGAPSGLSLSMKLPVSRDFALVFGFTEPTAYGLGRSGWVSARFDGSETPDLDLLKRWIRESYKAIAPKKLSASLPEED